MIKEDLNGVSVVTASELDSEMMTKGGMRGGGGGANTFFRTSGLILWGSTDLAEE